jgi:predicted cobalt transporter CbtA
MAEIADSNTGPAVEIERLTRKDTCLQVLCGLGIASGLALLWTMETMRNGLFWGLNALHIRPRRRRRGSAFPAGQSRS